jgi:hypothetical protein
MNGVLTTNIPLGVLGLALLLAHQRVLTTPRPGMTHPTIECSS